jgi:ElaB/YqjD/DUF883 family membrane-anchored ribosome-binding protein
MDEQRIQDRVSEAAEKVGETIGTMAGDSTKQAGAAVQAKLDQGKAMIQDAQASAATLARQASEAGNKRWLKPGSWCKVPHAKPATRRRKRRQTSIRQGSRAGDVITQYAAEQPVTALLVAGAIGYGLAYLIHRR